MNFHSLIEKYLEFYPEEAADLAELKAQVIETADDKQMISRKNFRGHFTAAAFLLAEEPKSILLIEHKFLKKDLQPGGHIEIDAADPLAAAMRELQEETSIAASEINYRALDRKNPLIPFDISIHPIPYNQKKREEAHRHYDLRYFFKVKEPLPTRIAENEVSKAKWLPFKAFSEITEFRRVASKIEKL